VTPDHIVLGVTWYVVFLFSTTLHEAAHAFVAHKLGDSTAYQGGQVSLNPIPHIRREPVGTVIVPLVSFAISGWMIGWASAPYDPFWASRHHRRAALMALAGPAANLVLVLAAALAIRAGMSAGAFYPPPSISFSQVTAARGEATALVAPLSILFTLNLILFVFNLFPLPPLDGSSVLPIFMQPATAERYRAFLHQPMFSLLGMVLAWNLFGPVFRPVHTLALNLLYPGVGYQ